MPKHATGVKGYREMSWRNSRAAELWRMVVSQVAVPALLYRKSLRHIDTVSAKPMIHRV